MGLIEDWPLLAMRDDRDRSTIVNYFIQATGIASVYTVFSRN
jgi:hypothetical protein